MAGFIVFHIFCIGYCIASIHKWVFNTKEKRKGFGYIALIILIIIMASLIGPYRMGIDVHKLYTTVE